mmetsp:Transcript_58059/g.92225  ORF Transcript_58059/g.92225 Transcript_58059/m.92225 type:complete len:218 (-) Transcript_58059:650-1303(-)
MLQFIESPKVRNKGNKDTAMNQQQRGINKNFSKINRIKRYALFIAKISEEQQNRKEKLIQHEGKKKKEPIRDPCAFCSSSICTHFKGNKAYIYYIQNAHDRLYSALEAISVASSFRWSSWLLSFRLDILSESLFYQLCEYVVLNRPSSQRDPTQESPACAPPPPHINESLLAPTRYSVEPRSTQPVPQCAGIAFGFWCAASLSRLGIEAESWRFPPS